MKKMSVIVLDGVSSTFFDDSSISDLKVEDADDPQQCERKREPKSFLEKESRKIARFHRIILLVFVIFGIGCSYFTFRILQNEERLALENQFQQEASDFLMETLSSTSSSISLLKSLASTITSTAVSTESRFPNVTLPSSLFVDLSSDIIDTTDFNFLFYAPLVETLELAAWEKYSTEQQRINHETPVINSKVSARDNSPYESPAHHLMGQVLPVWQVAPRSITSATQINTDFCSRRDIEHVAVAMTSSVKPILSGASDLGFITDRYIDRSESKSNLSSYLMEPVSESFRTGSEVKGAVVAAFSWDSIFQGRRGPKGLVHLTVDDGCGQVFTYGLKYSDSVFLGMGKLHEKEMEESMVLVEFMEAYRYTRGSVPHPPINGQTYDEYYNNTEMGNCAYTLKMYPTVAYFSALGDSEGSLSFALLVFAIFAIPIFLLLVYDFLVARPQRNLLNKVTQPESNPTYVFT